ncbi:hypothetical protein SAMN05216184_11947 [Georgenia satyanarayanai]|uniref:ParB-like C-terminal domain-containing protein n=1 Tax=Georgenia satyanarayanai TaxID=860221 RepID=A0A2Y9C0V7_9MICO|nr:hypothetical protein [Georgenia satyanarayanai]PYF96387.1 hypothetical protein A8987_11947 [Georgenia satyanarayanai]SSA46942.1 hypothetical protein SAMN05216184_11947 [Georgenia satyanarayanai]
MSRPTPRKTSLARLSPTDPPPPAASAPGPEVAAPAAPPPPGAGPVAAPAGQPAGEKRKYRHKVSFYQDEDDTARVRAAILHTNHIEGPRSLSEFINHAVMAEVERLERKHNAGQPWPGVGARELPQGRPMGH